MLAWKPCAFVLRVESGRKKKKKIILEVQHLWSNAEYLKNMNITNSPFIAKKKKERKKEIPEKTGWRGEKWKGRIIL